MKKFLNLISLKSLGDTHSEAYRRRGGGRSGAIRGGSDYTMGKVVKLESSGEKLGAN